MDERLAKAIAILRTTLGDKTMTTTTTTTTATYTKLSDGAWGLRANGPLAPGQQVTVTTRDGRVKTETVGAIVYSQNGVTVAEKGAARPLVIDAPPAPVAAARIESPDALARIIIDLETALAGLKALQRAA